MQFERSAILIPTLNEAKWIKNLLQFIRTETQDITVFVIDAGSVDDTQKIVRTLMQRDPNLLLLENPTRLQAGGLNYGSQEALKKGKAMLIRMDAHAHYPAGFVVKALNFLRSGDCNLLTCGRDVAVPPKPTFWQNWAARWSNSPFHHIGAKFRSSKTTGQHNLHGHHIAWFTQELINAGGYNPELAAYEDIEFEKRLVARGGKIMFTPELRVGTYPRENARRAFEQFFRNGKARVHAEGWAAFKAKRLGLALISGLTATAFLIFKPILSLSSLLIIFIVWPPLLFGLLASTAFLMGAFWTLIRVG